MDITLLDPKNINYLQIDIVKVKPHTDFTTALLFYLFPVIVPATFYGGVCEYPGIYIPEGLHFIPKRVPMYPI